jgi:hypothetical protein
VNPQNYSGTAMATGVPLYAPGSVPVAAPVTAPGFSPASSTAPFDARNYLPPSSPQAAPFDARNYVPPDFTPMQSTYEPRTSESAFNNSMLLHGGAATSPAPVVPPAYLYSPALSSSRSAGSESYTYTQSPSALSRSVSTRPNERETWLYDRPGTWRPRFQMPRSGVGSIMQNFSRVKSFPPGASYDFFPPLFVFCIKEILISAFFDDQLIRHRGHWTNAYASPPSGNHQSCGTCERNILGSCSAN